MTYAVITTVTGPAYFLRGTTWTSDATRASFFDTEEAAKAALTKVAKFNPRAARKAMIIEQDNS